jgi:uncharacterized phage-associated protein
MRFVYNSVKAAQAAAKIIKMHGAPIDTLVLMKLLYLADREALLDSGYTITGDTMMSMPHGPVLTNVLDSVTCNARPWRDYMKERQNHLLALENQEPNDDELSEYEIGILAKIHQRFGHLRPWEIRKMTHELPEYEDPNGSSSRIEPADILKFAGKSDHEIEVLTREAESIYIVEHLVKA